MVVTARSEPSSSATQPQCPTDAWHNASSSSRSGRLVTDGRSTRDLLDSDKDSLVDLEMRLDALESGRLFAGRYCPVGVCLLSCASIIGAGTGSNLKQLMIAHTADMQWSGRLAERSS